ncbi:hypothetical protein [Streptomyces radiopugnans]|uniref:hypothetical protein n=1 Tax=Streptomyces radiopugnans TaxID=403935 RepID=UPI003F19E998
MSAMDLTALCLGALIMTVSAALTGFAVAAARTSGGTGVWCEATVLDAGTHREWLLDCHRARNPRHALRWIRAQAPRLADRIDPPPDVPWAAPGTIRPYEPGEPCDPGGVGPADAAAVLRHRTLDGIADRDALRVLEDGGLHVLTAPDGDGLRYRLSARALR